MIQVFLFLFLALTGCAGRGARMNQDTYEGVQTGAPIRTVESQLGKPYAIHSKGGGVEEYEYIERIAAGTYLVSENHYFLIVVNGLVVGKYTKREEAPAYDLIYQDDPNHHWYP